MNSIQFDLPELTVQPHQVKEVLRCLCQTILFNRALGSLRPRDVDSDLFDITYPRCGDPAMDRLVESKIEEFVRFLDKNDYRKGQLVLSFFERRVKKVWFSKHEEKVYWETWTMNVDITPEIDHPGERQVVHQRVEEALRECLMQIVQIVNEKRDHIPPVTTTDVAPFPYEITIPNPADSWNPADLVKKMLQTPPPILS
eukprot:GFYU01005058.1.p1 GENE.GFYU01005058.1~~GFYU01005058.1.p1  ORF type:complete len:199 (-),score=33.24 GFYU01005058.1:454-1050(-)